MNAQTCSRPRAGIHTTIMGQIANRTCLWQRSVRRTDMQVYMPVQVQIYMPRRRSGRPPTSTHGDSSPRAAPGRLCCPAREKERSRQAGGPAPAGRRKGTRTADGERGHGKGERGGEGRRPLPSAIGARTRGAPTPAVSPTACTFGRHVPGTRPSRGGCREEEGKRRGRLRRRTSLRPAAGSAAQLTPARATRPVLARAPPDSWGSPSSTARVRCCPRWSPETCPMGNSGRPSRRPPAAPRWPTRS